MTNTETPRPVGADPTSIFGKLEQQREQVVSEQTKVLRVQRWHDPDIYVRYKLVDHEIIRRALGKIDDAKKADKGKIELEANCDVLIAGCVEVWGELDGNRYSLNPDDVHGEYTTFDSDLGRNLGLSEQCTARQVVRRLFLSDGDVLATAGTIIAWCGYSQDEIDGEIDKG